MRIEFVVASLTIVLGGFAAAFLVSTTPTPSINRDASATPYVEIQSPAGFINTQGVTLGELVGKKVIVVDFMTYSCINCLRTFPYLNAWYKEYRDDGLEIVGIHTPEFAFERDISNVKKALEKEGIRFPVVLDNEYATWRAYGNNYWPRKYLIDIEGNIVYDHIGEGAYDVTERKIQELLAERVEKMGNTFSAPPSLATLRLQEPERAHRTQEMYFGSLRNSVLANGSPRDGSTLFILPDEFTLDRMYLGGEWTITPEYAEASAGSSIVIRYRGKEVYMVAHGSEGTHVSVIHDGERVSAAAGSDVLNGGMDISEDRLHTVIENAESSEHVLELRIESGMLQVFSFTFG